MNKNIWNKFLEFADKGKGLGTYINQEFKQMIDDNNYDYYELIVTANHSKTNVEI